MPRRTDMCRIAAVCGGCSSKSMSAESKGKAVNLTYTGAEARGMIIYAGY